MPVIANPLEEIDKQTDPVLLSSQTVCTHNTKFIKHRTKSKQGNEETN